MAKRQTDAQARQRELAWLLFQLRGARGNLGHTAYRYKHVGPAIESRLKVILQKLEELDGFTQHTLQRDQALRAASLRRTSHNHPKESS